MRGRWDISHRTHVCRTPPSRLFRAVRTGDRWTCRCGQTWRARITWSGPWSTLTWSAIN